VVPEFASRILDVGVGFYKIRSGFVSDQSISALTLLVRNGKRIDEVALETPPFLRKTTGWWLDIPKATLKILRTSGLNSAEGIHSACHAILNQFAMQQDLKTECKLAVKEYKSQPSRRKRPAR
jgi:DEAD/DEAH box helicase domain-containing protein